MRSGAAVTDAMAAARQEERRRAARALLRSPLLRAGGAEAEAFVLVRRHGQALREWFDRNTGWRLVVDSEVARLSKTQASTADATHPARDVKSKQPFGRRRYVLACLALAALERADAQITLGRLAEQVVLAAAAPELTAAGVEFTLEGRAERADLVAVVRLLLSFGVVSRVAGDEDSFLSDTGDVLYDVQRRVLASLLATPRGPSTVKEDDFAGRLTALTYELPPTTDDLRNQRLRHQLTRRLLEAPVVYYDELDEAERGYLSGQRGAIVSRITEFTGLVAEVRAEGIAMVDPTDDLTDVRMPESGTEGHATLLLAEYLANNADRSVDVAELQAHVREQADAHRGYWRRSVAEAGAEVELTRIALGRLEALHLIDRTLNAVGALPALARYSVSEPTISGGTGES